MILYVKLRTQDRTTRRKYNHIIKISDYYEMQRRRLIIEIITKDATDPITNICIDRDTLHLKSYDTKRVGRPRFN